MPDMLDMPLDDIIMKNTGSKPSKGGQGNNRVGPVKNNRRGNKSFNKRQGQPNQNEIPRNHINTTNNRSGHGRAPNNTPKNNNNRMRRVNSAPHIDDNNSARARIHARMARDGVQVNANNRQRNRDTNTPYSNTQRRNRNKSGGRNVADSELSRQRSTQRILNRNSPPQRFTHNQPRAQQQSVPNLQIAITNDRARQPLPSTGRMYSDYYGNANHSTMESFRSPAVGAHASSLSSRFSNTTDNIRRL